MLCLSLSHPRLFPLRLPSFSSLHLCLSWLEEGLWGPSALVLLNGWQMTKKLEAFRSWQVVVCARFFFSPPFFLLQMFFVSLFSVKLSRQHNKCNRCARAHTHTHTHTLRITHMQKHMCRFFCVLIGDRSDFVFSDWWQWEEGEEPLAHKDVFPSANYRDRLWLPVWKQVFKQL